MVARVGVVVIGRNEGERLRRCLQSLDPMARPTVYVDSGSTDTSVAVAGSLGADVVPLDLTTQFTAARARNAGFDRLLALAPGIEYVQFVDGDSEVDPRWLDAAVAALDGRPEVVVACGRRRERHPDLSIYNRLCDLEWDVPIGPAISCGGDALMRVAAFRAVGGYRADLIAGEEPELCVRLRAAGGSVMMVDALMTRHDAAMTRFGQWWKRNVRAGHAFAEVARLHRRNPFGIWRREVRSNWAWGLALPFLALGLWPITWGLSPLLFGGYFVLFLKIYRGRRQWGNDPLTARRYAFFCVLSKMPQALGQVLFWRNRLLGRRGRLIEYKGP